MARPKPLVVHPDIVSGRVGLAVVDIQTLHWGHVRLLTHMLASCDTPILAIGSCQISGVAGHPFTFEQKKAMVEGLFGDAFRFLRLNDIDAGLETTDWLDYVLSRIRASGLPEPTDYFCGSDIDARHYTAFFARLTDRSHLEGQARVHRSQDGSRRLHVLDRATGGNWISGRDLRFLIENRDAEWRSHVPQLLWRFIEMQYPAQLRVALQVEHEENLPQEVSVGTRCIIAGHAARRVVVLKDDGKWRPYRDAPDEKTTEALSRRRT